MGKQRKKHTLIKGILFLILICGFVVAGVLLYRHIKPAILAQREKESAVERLEKAKVPDWVDKQLIHKHNVARSGKKLVDVKNIVVHYVGNPGTSAQNNRDYFDKDSTEVSSHFVIGLEGEIIQCLPLYERSAASNHRNKDTISIEVCHPDESGKFSDDTYASLVRLTAWLLDVTQLEADDVIRHYDITGKLCPLYYVEHEDAWKTFIKDVNYSSYE